MMTSSVNNKCVGIKDAATPLDGHLADALRVEMIDNTGRLSGRTAVRFMAR